jgi:hypothetical protein
VRKECILVTIITINRMAYDKISDRVGEMKPTLSELGHTYAKLVDVTVVISTGSLKSL